MKKRILYLISLLLCIVMCFTLSSCSLIVATSAFVIATGKEAHPYELEYEKEEIKTVVICYVESSSDDYSIVEEIEDVDSFLDKFAEIKFLSNLLGDFVKLHDEYAIFIEYKNGDIEIIGYKAQKTVIDGMADSKGMYCDKEIFNELINLFAKL